MNELVRDLMLHGELMPMEYPGPRAYSEAIRLIVNAYSTHTPERVREALQECSEMYARTERGNARIGLLLGPFSQGTQAEPKRDQRGFCTSSRNCSGSLDDPFRQASGKQ